MCGGRNETKRNAMPKHAKFKKFQRIRKREQKRKKSPAWRENIKTKCKRNKKVGNFLSAQVKVLGNIVKTSSKVLQSMTEVKTSK